MNILSPEKEKVSQFLKEFDKFCHITSIECWNSIQVEGLDPIKCEKAKTYENTGLYKENTPICLVTERFVHQIANGAVGQRESTSKYLIMLSLNSEYISNCRVSLDESFTDSCPVKFPESEEDITYEIFKMTIEYSGCFVCFDPIPRDMIFSGIQIKNSAYRPMKF